MKHDQEQRKLDQQMKAAERALISKDLTIDDYTKLIEKLQRQKIKLSKKFGRGVRR
jgi:hypothetical protein